MREVRGKAFVWSAWSGWRRATRREVVRCGTVRVAVIGSGLAGLTVCDRLVHAGDVEVVVIDENPVGTQNASAAAAGLLHKFSPRGKKVFMADRAFDRATAFIGEFAPNCIVRRGPIVRAALSMQQKKDYAKAAHSYPAEVELIEGTAVHKAAAGLNAEAALIIKDSLVINVQHYLQTLWQRACKTGRASYSCREIKDVHSLLLKSEFDKVVVAAGHRCAELVPGLQLDQKLGRNVIFRPRSGQGTPLAEPRISGKYVVPRADGGILAGATFESRLSIDGGENTVQNALKEMGDKIYDLYSPLHSDYDPVDVTVGIRGIPVRPPGKAPIPFVLRASPNVWLLGGLASRGLLHHAVFGDFLAEALIKDDVKYIPAELQLPSP